MTKPRTKTRGYLTFVVEPTSDFTPTNWQEVPASYRIVEFSGAKRLLGEADSWKFLHNQAALRQNSLSSWAIHISVRSADASARLSEAFEEMGI